jgi:hypothetical protein
VTLVVGWFEPIALPELGIERAFARMDTGADFSTLHARDVLLVEEGRVVEFTPPLLRVQRASDDWQDGGLRRVRAPLVAERWVRSSNGGEEQRLVIRSRLVLGAASAAVELGLTSRGGMRFPALIGRSALAALGALVDPSRSELTEH